MSVLTYTSSHSVSLVVFIRYTPKSKTVRSKIHTKVFDICCQTGFQKLYQLEKTTHRELKPVLLDNQEGWVGWEGGSRGRSRIPVTDSCWCVAETNTVL